ncbi:hypothetical protein BOX15_Mlig023503g4, partial [Macrostomum lignano]
SPGSSTWLCQAMATADHLRAALEADDRECLLRQCGQLDVNLTLTSNGYEATVTHHVAFKPYGLDCLKRLVDKLGAACLTTEVDDGGDLPLHVAALRQDEKSMEFIRNSAGPECFELTGQFNRTIVHMAAQNEHSSSALMWLVKQIGPDCLSVLDSDGNTPVHLAAWKQDEASMRFIKEQLGTDCFVQRGEMQRTAVHMSALNVASNSAFKWLVCECGPGSLTEKDTESNTPVHLAALRQGEDSMQFINAQLGSQVFLIEGNNGGTSVNFAAENCISKSALAWCARELDPKCLLVKDSFGRMPIHLAALHQDEHSMQLLVSSLGRDCLTLPGEMQRTAVHYAALNSSSSSALRWIVGQLGPDCLKLTDSEGSMALHLAAQVQGVDSLSLILDSLGADAFKLEGLNGLRMAHYAAANSQKQELLAWIASEIGPDSLHEPDALGRTATELAAEDDE